MMMQPKHCEEVEFLNGSIYQYYNVPVNTYEQLMQAWLKRNVSEYVY